MPATVLRTLSNQNLRLRQLHPSATPAAAGHFNHLSSSVPRPPIPSTTKNVKATATGRPHPCRMSANRPARARLGCPAQARSMHMQKRVPLNQVRCPPDNSYVATTPLVKMTPSSQNGVASHTDAVMSPDSIHAREGPSTNPASKKRASPTNCALVSAPLRRLPAPCHILPVSVTPVTTAWSHSHIYGHAQNMLRVALQPHMHTHHFHHYHHHHHHQQQRQLQQQNSQVSHLTCHGQRRAQIAKPQHIPLDSQAPTVLPQPQNVLRQSVSTDCLCQ
ncbi:unnamed protein product [Protopolystoma xenopodis]|uniref:Uncharacterized protein n=1 Tax=Protopolystoma xenopodis TaxID=117903 RepID=A0A448X7H6_9PLAT|nr:unnamed protein product [Protopolystoma xenopodis]